ncbi:MAG: PorP/SprF family type IX secretion system membrane protein [Chitinophagales bacterium]
MKYFIHFISFFVFVGSSPFSTVNAQQTNFSLLSANYLELNPAYAAIQPGGTLYLHYRKQWLNIPGTYDKYNLAISSVNRAFNNLNVGVGFTADREIEGEGLFKRDSYGLVVAMSSIGGNNGIGGRQSNSNANFAVGVKFNYNFLTIDWENLTFGDQIDPVLGPIFPTQAILPDSPNPNYFNFEIGGLFRSNQLVVGVNMKNIFLGYTDVSLYGLRLDEKLQLLSTHASFMFGINPQKFYLEPIAKLDYYFQSKLSSISIGTNLACVFSGGKSNLNQTGYQTLFAGLYYHQRPQFIGNKLQTTGALVMSLGFKIKPKDNTIQIVTSYEANGGSLANRQSGGTFECALKFNMGKGWSGKNTACDFLKSEFDFGKM